MSPLAIIGATFAVSLVAISGCALYGFRHGNDLSLIDGYYGFASLVHVIVTFVLWHEVTGRGALVGGVVAAWSFGLGLHMSRRWWVRERHHGGDVRYRQTSEKLGFGDGAQKSTAGYQWKTYVVIAIPQVVLIALLNLPVQLAIMVENVPLRVTDVVGAFIIAIGGVLENTSNTQLERFKATRRPGQTLMTGLFAWSRHPNYFGNVLVYVGAFIVVVFADRGLWWSIVSPLTILFVLRFMLGVRMTDQLMLEKRRGDVQYERYVATTPAFVPMPPGLQGVVRPRKPGH